MNFAVTPHICGRLKMVGVVLVLAITFGGVAVCLPDALISIGALVVTRF